MTQLETRTEPMVVNFGPHHPSMHGVLRLALMALSWVAFDSAQLGCDVTAQRGALDAIARVFVPSPTLPQQPLHVASASAAN